MPRKRVTIGTQRLALDARPDRLDLRDLPYRPPLGNLPAQHPSEQEVREMLPRYAENQLVLDQGQEGACTGFGLAAVINFLFFLRAQRVGEATSRKVSPAMLYQLARRYDEWPGDDYEGSSCRGALKGWHRHGVCREALWPHEPNVVPAENAADRDDGHTNWDIDALACTLGVYYRVDTRSIVDLQAAIHDTGALYVSATVHPGWAVKTRKTLKGHADLVRITHVPLPKAGQAGGHAFALVGYNEDGFVVQNSWGPDWGSRGFALLPYEDWVTHGEDAWVFTLGVPRRHGEAAAAASTAGSTAAAAAASARVRSPRFTVPSSEQRGGSGQQRPVGLIAGDDALTRRYRDLKDKSVVPLDADVAYHHAVVLDRGFAVCNDIVAHSPAQAMDGVARDRPLAWLREKGAKKLLIYAHGGLNSESASITRIRAMAPYALKHGIYPLFVTWRSGAMETVSDLVEEWFAKLGFGAGRGAEPARGWMDRLTDKTDRLLESVLRAPGGAMWGQMKLNAERAATHEDGGTRLLVDRLQQLAAAQPGLEIHLIGHSAGSIVIGAMLEPMRQAGLKACTARLFAPACTTEFALRTYCPAVQNGTLDARHFHLHLLSDDNERDDSVGPYRKSLLYLVSRAFEDQHKTPLLGLARSFDEGTASADATDDAWSGAGVRQVTQWQTFWRSLGVDASNYAAHLLKERRVSTGRDSIAASHGCFDNAAVIMGQALGYIADPEAPKPVLIERLDY